MHPIQQSILVLLKDQGSTPLKYREIGRKIGQKYPQTVKHHIEALLKKNLIQNQNGFLKLTETQKNSSGFISIPFYGVANCGPATCFAEDKIQGFIKISTNILPQKNLNDLYLIRASGNSMNEAEVGPKGKNIEDGDFVIVDAKNNIPKDGDYILSVIDECANIKRFHKNENQISLLADSSDNYYPIILDEADNFHVMGKIVDVIKSTN